MKKSHPRTALIVGISGQDGAYLAKQLLESGMTVHGTSRDREMSSFSNLHRLGIYEKVRLSSVVPIDFRSVLHAIAEIRPSEIYNLASQSAVGLSFEQPVETLNSTILGTVNILEAIRFLALDTKFYSASSSECFGNIADTPADEETPLRPRSPYGVGKAAAHMAIVNYRESYNIFACSGLFFNHESPLRPSRFVTQKIIRGAADIAEKKYEHLKLGALDISRDWGWAPEYVDAMIRIIRLDSPEDFVIATGHLSSLEDFVDHAFGCFGLSWKKHVEIDSQFLRPSDIARSVGNPAKAERLLNWKAEIHVNGVIERLVESELTRRRVIAGLL